MTHTATPLSDILDHIEASAPCSLFNVAVWAEEQLTLTPVGLVAILDTLASAGAIRVESDETGITIELI